MNEQTLADFEAWAMQYPTAYDLTKSPGKSMPNENPFGDSITWKAYEAWCGSRKVCIMDSKPMLDAYEKGWIAAADWADRDDLRADIGSPTYVLERDQAIQELAEAGVHSST